MNNVVSVPLRGYGFEMTIRLSESVTEVGVSVPLRGYGFEILVTNLFPLTLQRFPSPCGDMVLK